MRGGTSDKKNGEENEILYSMGRSRDGRLLVVGGV